MNSNQVLDDEEDDSDCNYKILNYSIDINNITGIL